MDRKDARPRKLKIGEVASQAGVNVETLRYYERVGLLEKPDRRESGLREYNPRTIEKVRLIKSAQALGYSLKEIEQLAYLAKVDGTDAKECSAALAIAQVKLNEINAKIESLKALKASIESVISSCSCMVPQSRLPIVHDEAD